MKLATNSQVPANIGGAAEIKDGGQDGNWFAVGAFGITINRNRHVLRPIILCDRHQYFISQLLFFE